MWTYRFGLAVDETDVDILFLLGACEKKHEKTSVKLHSFGRLLVDQSQLRVIFGSDRTLFFQAW